MKYVFSLLAFFYLAAYSFAQDEYPHIYKEEVPPQVIEKQLTQAEKEFAVAQKMFNPYYAGPLLAASASNVPPGSFMAQPYLFVIDTYAVYDSKRRSRNIPDIIQINPTSLFETGITNWLDISAIPSIISNHQSGQHSTNFGDSKLILGFQLNKETLHIPQFRFTVAEIFPTGKYEHLNPKKNGIDATGAGSFQTQLSLIFQKIVFWFPLHPMRLRFNFNYQISVPTHVSGFNAYGGGNGTNGKIKPGNTFSLDWALEYSITKKWVFAIDWVYIDQRRSNFSGKRGRDSMGNPNSVGAPSSDQMSFAPAIQYNFSSNLGMLAGTWFTFRGRNSADFVGAILTIAIVW